MAGWAGIRDYFSLRTLRLCGEKLLDPALSGVLTFLGFTAINEQNLPVDEGAVYEVVESTQDVGQITVGLGGDTRRVLCEVFIRTARWRQDEAGCYAVDTHGFAPLDRGQASQVRQRDLTY